MCVDVLVCLAKRTVRSALGLDSMIVGWCKHVYIETQCNAARIIHTLTQPLPPSPPLLPSPPLPPRGALAQRDTFG